MKVKENAPSFWSLLEPNEAVTSCTASPAQTQVTVLPRGIVRLEGEKKLSLSVTVNAVAVALGGGEVGVGGGCVAVGCDAGLVAVAAGAFVADGAGVGVGVGVGIEEIAVPELVGDEVGEAAVDVAVDAAVAAVAVALARVAVAVPTGPAGVTLPFALPPPPQAAITVTAASPARQIEALAFIRAGSSGWASEWPGGEARPFVRVRR